MKLSAYASRVGLTYQAVWRMWKRGELDARQLPSGTVIVNDKHPERRRTPKARGFGRNPIDKNCGGGR